ncbi:T9SS type A sorting domain-containing protein [Patiriisocius sp. Uisw_017]|uniref:T9SS type A sorting domain-containing protein n=1 Tax=Patiriisocius sp. Uisw_017 TaxID=3230968 RepID=UPI0039EB7B20
MKKVTSLLTKINSIKRMTKNTFTVFFFFFSIAISLQAQTMTFDAGVSESGFSFSNWARLTQYAIAQSNLASPSNITKAAGTWNAISFTVGPWTGDNTITVSSNLGHSQVFNSGATGTIYLSGFTGITTLTFERTAGSGDSADYDNLVYTTVAACTDPDVPLITASPTTICPSGSSTLSWTGSLNDATAWHVYTTSCGVTQLTTTTSNSLVVSPSSTTTYYIRGEGGCVTAGSCGSRPVTVNSLDNASFSYSTSAYCVDAVDPTPIITGLGGGTFSSTGGLNINAGTGAIDVSASTPGTYTVTYTTAGSCPNSSGVGVTINALDDASFNYGAAAYCLDDADPTPTITGLAGGSFLASAGLTVNNVTGAIDVSTITPGSYTVTYSTFGACANSSSVSVIINALDDASFNYGAAAYCVDASYPTPTIFGLGGGTFSSTGGLSINAVTGAIDASASTPGTYTVTYTTAGSCPNSSGVGVTINALDDASFNYGAAAYCVDASYPTPTIFGLGGGTFSSTGGLSINAGTGAIDVSASTPGTYTVTYTTAGSCPNSSGVGVTINAAPTVTFTAPTDLCLDAGNQTGLGGGSPTGGLYSGPGVTDTGDGVNYAFDPATAGAGTHTITYNFTDGNGCSGSANDNVVVFALPTVTFTALADLCLDAGTQTGLTGGSPTGGVYSGTGVTDVGDGINYSFDPAAAGAGTHTITYSFTDGNSCTGSANDNVVVFSLPTVTFAALGDLCLDAGNQTNQTGGSPAGGVYSGTGVTDAGDGINYTFDPAAAGVGTHTITYNFTDGNGCSGSANDNVVVFGLPTVSFATLGDLCVDAGNQTGLTGGSPAGGVYSGPGVVDDGNGITYSFNPAFSGVGTHTITYNFTDGNGCSGSANDNVVVFAVPTVTFTALADLCLDAGIQTGLTGGSPTGGVYSGPGVTDVGDGINYSFDPAVAGAGTHTITYIFTDGNGCDGGANDNVVVFGLDNASFSYSAAGYCLGDSDPTPTITGLGGGTFTVLPLGLNINQTTGFINIGLSAPNTYTVTYTTGGTCLNSSNVGVVIGTPPASPSVVSPMTVCPGDDVILSATGSGAGSLIFYNSIPAPLGAVPMPPATATLNIGSLAPGVYTFGVTESNGTCQSLPIAIIVTVGDVVAPTAICQDITVYLDGTGNVTISPNDLDGGATDNCGTVTVTASQTVFTCADVSTGPAPANDLVISGVIDGPLVGGMPKAIEFYVINDIADLSQYGVGSANNGGGTDGEEFTFPAVAVTAGTYIYLAIEAAEFTNYFGFAPDYTNNNAPLLNGDDAVELFFQTTVIDVFGDINLDGTGQPWEYQDGWAYRNVETGPDGSTFQLGSWSFSGPNAIDTELTNATAAIPFPTATFTRSGGPVDVTVTFDDGNGNSSNCIANVTVLDTISPTISCPGNQVGSVDGSCNFTILDYTGLATPADNCLGLVVTQVPAAGTIVGVGTTNIVLTATDGSSNTANCNFDVEVFGLPTVTFTAPTDLCLDAGNQTGLGGGLPTGGLYSGSGVTDTGDGINYAFDPAAAGVGTHTITYNFTDGNSCSGSENDTVVVFGLPTVTFTAPTDLCLDAGNQTGLGGGLPTGGLYSGPGVTDTGDGINYAFDPAAAGVGTHTITYTFTDGNGCSGSENDTVVVFSLPTVTFTAPTDLCLDAGNQTNQTGGSPTGGLYSGPGVTDTGDGINYSFDPAAAGVGTHTITYNFTDGNGCSGSANDAVVVFGLPTVTFTAPTDLCLDAGNQTNQTGGSPIGGVYSGPGVTDAGDGINYAFDPAAAGVGTHTITYNFTDGNGCSGSENDTVEVFPLPTVTFTAPTDLCLDAGVQTGLGGGTSPGGVYSGTGVTDNGNGMTYSFDPAAAGVGVHTLMYTLGIAGCTDAASDDVEVFALPVVTFTALTDLCIDAGVQTSLGGATPAGGLYSGSGVTDDGDGMTYSFDPAAAGVGLHVLTYTVSDSNGCTSSASDNVEVFVIPTVTYTAPADLCIDAGVQAGLGGATPAGGVYSGTGVTDDANGMTYSFDPAAAGVGTHTITYDYTDANSCSGSATDNVAVFALPTVVFTAPADLCITAGVQAGLSGGSPTGGVYSGAGVTDNGNGMTYSFDPAAAGAGTHTITYTFEDGNGCSSSASDDVEVFTTPVVAFTALADVCVDAGVQTGLGGGLASGGVYSGPGVTDDGNGMTYNFDPVAAGVGIHSITYTLNDSGCIGTAMDTIEVFDLPVVAFTAPADICITEGVQAGLGGGTPTGGVYSGTGVTDDANGMTYSFDPTAAGIGPNTISYTFTNGNGCTNSASDDVEVLALPIVTFTAPADLCVNAGVQTGLSGGSPTGGVYSGTGVTDGGDGMTYSFDPAVAGVGTQSISYTAGDVGCTNTAADTVQVFGSSIVTFNAPADLCIDAGIQTGLGGALPTGGTYYGPGVSDDGNGMTYSFDPAVAGAGVQTLVYLVGNIGCLSTGNDTVEVFDAPTVTFVVPTPNICVLDVVVTGLGGGTPTGGIYSGIGVSDDGNGMTFSFDPTASAPVGGNIPVTYTYADTNGCSNDTTENIFVNDAINCDACQATATFGAAGWGAVMPSIDNLVLIEADYDTALLGSFEACKLIVNPGATLRVNAGDYILVNTDITVSVTGSLLVEHTGSVVQVEDSAMVTNDGTINVNVTTPEVAPRDFILSGSPMTMEMRNGVYNNSFRVVKHLTAAFNPDPAVDAFYMPNVVANFVDVDFNDWVFHTGIINPGEGYFVYPQANLADGNSTYDLVYEQGTLNNGVITYAMEFNGDANSSPSMLANPYPSAIDASLFLNANPEIDEVYFWEHITEPGAFPGGNITTENFSMEDISMYNLSGGIGAGTPATNGSTTPNGMIATSQGFGVKANAMGTAIFNNAMRVTTGNNTLRNTVSEGNKIWLQLENAQYSLSSEVLIAFMPMATESYDSGYDSHQIGSLVSLYSHLPDNTMSLGIQGREVFNKEIQIPMGYASQIDETTTFKITIKQLEGVDIENATVYLIDKATRTITNLTKEGAYKFRSRKGNFPNRFTLQFMAYDRFGRILGDDAAAIAAISVVPNPTDGLLFINSPNSIINTITLTDMRGRLVRNLKNIDGLNSTIDISVLDSAVYFLKIETEKGTLVRKVMKE